MEPPTDAAAAPEWMLAILPWLVALLVVATAAVAVGVALVLQRLRELERWAERLTALDEISLSLQALVRDRADLDLRRIEHVLIEMRDGERRLEDAILRATQAGAKPSETATPRAGEPASLSERIIQRLLAHGYEQVHVVPTLEELAEVFGAEGVHEVLVEARRGGVQCKGRVLLRDGVVTDVELKPAYTMFP